MYEGNIRNLILKYKFNEKAYLYKTFVNFLLKQEKVLEIIKSYDIILPVPISKKRYNERGYNQTELIASKISKYAQIKLVTNCLYKHKNNVPQSTLNKDSRIENVKNAYNIKNSQIIKDKRILVFDDIYTTGSTVNECSKILIQNGAKNVGILTLAKD
jgi:ComF family protein